MTALSVSVDYTPAQAAATPAPVVVPGLERLRAQLDEAVDRMRPPAGLVARFSTMTKHLAPVRYGRLEARIRTYSHSLNPRRAGLRAEHARLVAAAWALPVLDPAGPVLLAALGGDQGAVEKLRSEYAGHALAAPVLAVLDAAGAVEVPPEALSAVAVEPSLTAATTCAEARRRRRPKPLHLARLVGSVDRCAPPVSPVRGIGHDLEHSTYRPVAAGYRRPQNHEARGGP